MAALADRLGVTTDIVYSYPREQRGIVNANFAPVLTLDGHTLYRLGRHLFSIEPPVEDVDAFMERACST